MGGLAQRRPRSTTSYGTPMPREPIPTHAFSLVLVKSGRRFLLVHEKKHGFEP